MRLSASATVIALLCACPGEFDPDLSDVQPVRGMWSPCEGIDDCAGLDLCMGPDEDGIFPGDGWVEAPGDAFCTRWSDGDPVEDCIPAPGGQATAVPAHGLTDAGESYCVLDCSGDRTCPFGMACRNVRSPAMVYEGLVCI